MRNFALLSLALTAGARASFDLVLVADNTGSFTGPTTSKIHRYDGDSGVYLGYIETGFSNINDLAVDQGTNEVYVATGNNVTVYNIGTGAQKRTFATGPTNAMRIAGGTLYRSSGTTLFSVNKISGGQSVVKTWSSTINDFAFAQHGGYVLYSASTTLVSGFSAAGAIGTSWGSSNIGANKGQVAFDGSFTNNFYLMGDVNAGITTFHHSATLSSIGTFTAGTQSYINPFFNTFVDVTAAHSGYYMYGKNNAGEKALYRMFSGSGNGGDRLIRTPQVTNAGQIAVVLAPEPGTFIAVGVGIAALLKKRKKSK